MLKNLLKKNKWLYFKLSLISRIGINTWLINFLFQTIFRRYGKVKFNLNFTSSISEFENIKYHYDFNTLTSFATSGHCYFQALNGIHLGKNLLFAPGVKIISSNHDVNDYRIHIKSKPITIGNNVWIGTNAVILPGVTIGNNCIIGAGSIVTKSFAEDNITIAGNPAIVINKIA